MDAESDAQTNQDVRERNIRKNCSFKVSFEVALKRNNASVIKRHFWCVFLCTHGVKKNLWSRLLALRKSKRARHDAHKSPRGLDWRDGTVVMSPPGRSGGFLLHQHLEERQWTTYLPKRRKIKLKPDDGLLIFLKRTYKHAKECIQIYSKEGIYGMIQSACGAWRYLPWGNALGCTICRKPCTSWNRIPIGPGS